MYWYHPLGQLSVRGVRDPPIHNGNDITEKYCDMFWPHTFDELLNGHKTAIDQMFYYSDKFMDSIFNQPPTNFQNLRCG